MVAEAGPAAFGENVTATALEAPPASWAEAGDTANSGLLTDADKL
jgi:hypothetical protein